MSQESSINSHSSDTTHGEFRNELQPQISQQEPSSAAKTESGIANIASKIETGEHVSDPRRHVSRRQRHVDMLCRSLRGTLGTAEDDLPSFWRLKFGLAKPMGLRNRQRKEFAFIIRVANERQVWFTKRDLPALQHGSAHEPGILEYFFTLWLLGWDWRAAKLERVGDGLNFIHHWVVLKGIGEAGNRSPEETELLLRLHERMSEEGMEPAFDKPEQVGSLQEYA